MKTTDLPEATITFFEAQRRYQEMTPEDKAVVIATKFEDDDVAATKDGMTRIIEHIERVKQEKPDAYRNRHTRRAEAVRRRGAKAGGRQVRS